MKSIEKKRRTFLKTLSFRFLATIVTMVLVFFFTASTQIALSIGVLEFVSKLILYYVHERVWDRVPWGTNI